MTLRALEQKYKDFYAPAFTVEVGREDLVRDLFLTVTSVEVDLKQKVAGLFTFTVANGFDWQSREFLARPREEPIDLIELFAFGSPVDIHMGYGEPSKLTPMLSGIITKISTSFSEGGTPDLTISGYDKLYPLGTGKHTRHWEEAMDSDAVSELVQPSGLSLDVRQTGPVRPRIDQSQESNLSFVKKLAERNGVTFYARGRDFYFGPRNNNGGESVELAWGKGLLTFKPEANLAKQVSSVEVHSRSADSGEPIVGRASSGEESGRDGGRESGAGRISALGEQPVMRVRAAVHTQAEADARARGILEERGEEFVKGDGESIGLPDIVPDVNVLLKDLSKSFSKPYYVREARHRVDGNGYKTSFKVEETTI